MRATLARRVIWLASAKAVAFGLGFALPLVLVRSLSQTEFGLYKQAFLLVNTATTILPLGFAMSAFYFLPRCEGEQGRVVRRRAAVDVRRRREVDGEEHREVRRVERRHPAVKRRRPARRSD